VHVFNFRDTTLVLDPVTGSLFAVDELAGEVIKSYSQISPREIKELLSTRFSLADIDVVLEEVKALCDEGLLNVALPDEPEQAEDNPQVKALCLHVAHDCNLRCKYCFAATGNFGGGRTLMDLETGKAAIDFLLLSSGSRKHLEVDFFGGEPLLNFSVVKELVAYGRQEAEKHSKVLRFTLTTNGTLLGEEEMRFLNENQLSVVLSLDGRAAVNDFLRPFADDAGSYTQVRDAILKFVASRGGKNYFVRGTYTAHNLDFSKDVEHLYDLGLREISLEPVVGGVGESYALTMEHAEDLCREYDRLADFYLEKQEGGDPFNFFHFNVATYNGPCFGKRIIGCGAGWDYVAVTPEGDIYPCHQFVGNEQFKLGTVFTGLVNLDLPRELSQVNVYRKPDCLACWAKLYCSGGCHASAFHVHGNFLTPDALACVLQKKRIECALGINALKNNI